MRNYKQRKPVEKARENLMETMADHTDTNEQTMKNQIAAFETAVQEKEQRRIAEKIAKNLSDIQKLTISGQESYHRNKDCILSLIKSS